MGSEPQRTRPLVPLSPDEVRQTTFRQSQLAWRGYSEDEVDAFKSMIADYLVNCEKERTALRAEIDRLRNFYRNHGTDVDLVGGSHRNRRRRSGTGEDLVNRISDNAEAHLEQARDYADLIQERAADRAEDELYHTVVRSSLGVEEWLRTRWDAGAPVGVGELRSALTWLRAFGYALQVDLQVVDDALAREGQRQEATPGIEPSRT